MDCPEPSGTETLNDQDGGTKRHRSSRTAGKRSGRHFLSDWFSEDKKCSSKGEDEFAVKEKLLLSKLIEANLNNTGVSGNSGNSELQKNAIPGFGQLKVRHSNPLQDNGMEMNRVEVTTQMLEDNAGLINSRTLLLTDIPPYTSLPAILSRIGGGPLQRIDLLKRHNWETLSEPHSWNQPIDWQQSVLKLQFDSHENAIIFYEHSRTNAFIVNGCHLLTLWMPDKCTPDPEKKGQDEIDKEILNLMAEPENARRVLVLKQPVPNKKRTAGRKHFSYPDPLANYSSDFDIEEVVGDFSRFGKIVEVTPVISRKLCFGIQFFDIVSAMDAKHNIEGDVEDQDELKLEIARKYGGWYVWYGKDPTDKPILA
ncbi:DEKNAAC101951 [Brettanomyces naardenensis]|uniref:DEKNAAC101951 n=1 Tax=Brettanomyces naardenensis TaxID=13370 RepID=A0A448YJH5_BRENA|nr:DEKNAAC101951 [Brettanomyces naardenensis]